MVGQLIKLKLLMQWNSIKRQTWLLVLGLIGLAQFTSIIGFLISGAVIAAWNGAVNYVGAAGVILGSVLILGWIIGPLVATGIDTTLEPRALVTYIPPSPKLAWASIIATGAGIAGILTALPTVALPLSYFVGAHILPGVIALLVVPIALLTAWTWSRLLATFLDVVVDNNPRLKDSLTLVGVVLFLAAIAPLGAWINLITNAARNDVFFNLASWLSWTPFGAAWAVPFSVFNGQYGAGVGQLAIALAFLALGLWLWSRLLPYAMSGTKTPLSAQVDQALSEGRFLVDPTKEHMPAKGRSRNKVHGKRGDRAAQRFLPGADYWQALGLPTAAASLAARTQVDWLKDPRLSSSLAICFIFPVMAVVFPQTMPDEVGSAFTTLSYMFLVLPAITLGAATGALPSYDSTAFWILSASGIRGRDERLGRLAGSAVVHIPLLAVTTATAGYVVGLTALESATFVVFLLALYMATAALCLLLSTRFVYPAQPPGASPLSSKGTGSFMLTIALQLGGQFGSFIVALPSLIVFLLAWYGIVALWVSILVSLTWAVFLFLITPPLTGRLWDTHHVKVLAQIRSWPGH